MNTEFGPLKDGEPQTPFYGNGPQAFMNGSWKVDELDAPNFKVPAQFGLNSANLTQTFGIDSFSSFLVLVREREKSIIELSRVDWKISWDGTFKPTLRKAWSPTHNAKFLTVEHSNNPTLYAKLYQPHAHVPFSLYFAEAEDFSEIPQDGEWKP